MNSPLVQRGRGVPTELKQPPRQGDKKVWAAALALFHPDVPHKKAGSRHGAEFRMFVSPLVQGLMYKGPAFAQGLLKVHLGRNHVAPKLAPLSCSQLKRDMYLGSWVTGSECDGHLERNSTSTRLSRIRSRSVRKTGMRQMVRKPRGEEGAGVRHCQQLGLHHALARPSIPALAS